MMLMDRNLEIYNTYPLRYFIQCRYSSVLVGNPKFSMAVYTQGTTINEDQSKVGKYSLK